MNRRQFLGGLAATAMGAAGLVSISPPPASLENEKYFTSMSVEERRRSRFLNVVLKTHEGREVRFYDDLIKDKRVLLNFFYTNCVGENLCPLATANLVKVQELLGKRIVRDTFIYSITLDPENDTPGVLKNYARAFGVKPGWLFLTGGKEDIERLRRNLGYVNADPVLDKDRSQHIGMLRYGIEPMERWAACPSLSAPWAIARYLSWMEPNGMRPDTRPPRPPAAVAG